MRVGAFILLEHTAGLYASTTIDITSSRTLFVPVTERATDTIKSDLLKFSRRADVVAILTRVTERITVIP